MEIENASSFEAALRDGINLFLGAGFSILAYDSQGRSMPLGTELAEELRAVFNEDAGRELNLPQLATVIGSSNAQGLFDYLSERCRVSTYDPRYRQLFAANVRAIFTTNIDDLAHRVYADRSDHYLHDVDFAGSAADEPSAVDYVALHGSIRAPGRPLKFGTLDIATAFETDRDRWASFRERLRKHPTVFLGYGLSDAGTLQALAAKEGGSRIIGDCWIQVRMPERDSAVVKYLRALGLQTIVADTDDVLEYAHQTVPHLKIAGPSASRTGSDRGNIPSPQDVPQRPITDFYLGAAPTWSDVFSGFLVKTAHFRTLRDAINGGKPTVITGIPGCGKTTLLMQIAAEMQFDGMRFLETDLNADRARLLTRRIAGRKALVLVDDVVNDIEALSILDSPSNITVVGADRDYRLATATHLLPSRCDIIRVSDQNPQDLQSIWDLIPLQIRGDRLRQPEVAQGVAAGLLEFIEANIKGPTLRERIAEAIIGLNRDDPLMAELLVLSCYVHSCRTPISMDMILGYTGMSFENYFDLRDTMASVGEMLHEYTGDLATEPQDYYTARSVILSESVLRDVPTKLLQSVLIKLHRDVSPVRIASYDIFRRSAFDHSIFNRAFRGAEDEALSLYDSLILRDGNEYIRQQKALFLADRGRFKEAFWEIDHARSRISRKPNWSIENSYYKILFSSNLPQSGTEEGLGQMHRALRGLESCFNSDRRKAMHALVHADCALKFAGVVRDASALAHLETAITQLRVAVEDSSWLDRPPELLGVVGRSARKLRRELGLPAT